MENTKRQPQRMCTGCGLMKDKRELIRVVLTPSGELQIDKKGKMSGRGAYICYSGECLKKAVKTRRLERSLKISVGEEIYQRLAEEIEKSE